MDPRSVDAMSPQYLGSNAFPATLLGRSADRSGPGYFADPHDDSSHDDYIPVDVGDQYQRSYQRRWNLLYDFQIIGT